MLRVIYPFFGNSVGGAIHSVIALAKKMKELDKSYDPIFVLHRPVQEFKDLLSSHDLKYVVSDFYFQKFPILSFIKILRIIFKLKPDVVHGNDIKINLHWSFASFLANIPYVWHQRSIIGGSKLWLLFFWSKRQFVAVSKAIRESYPKSVQDKIKVIPDPVVIDEQDMKLIREVAPYSVLDKGFHIGYFGRIVPQKNIVYLVELLKHLNEKVQVTLHLYGTPRLGYSKKIEALIGFYKLNNKVIFHGFTSNVLAEMNKVDAIITMAINDGWGRTIVEAQCLGKKVIASDSGGHRELIQNNIDGCLVPLGEPLVATKKIVDYLGSQNELKYKKYNNDYVVEKIKNLYWYLS